MNRLADIFPDASHVQFQGLTDADDSEIWEFAKIQGFCIVTQDADFAEKLPSLRFTAKGDLAAVWQYTYKQRGSNTSIWSRGNSRIDG